MPAPIDGFSIIKEHANLIVDFIRNTKPGEWKVLIVDQTTKKIIDNTVHHDEILNSNITDIERIEDRRASDPTLDAIYFLSPEPHIVDCLAADLERRWYRRGHVIWTGPLDAKLERRLENVRRQMSGPPSVLNVDFYPRESHLVTFRDPDSFLILYNPECNDLVGSYLQTLARKIVSVCVTLGELPKIRFYDPKHAGHEAAVLCMHLARFVQDEFDQHQQWDRNFPPQTNRPQSVLLVTDRSMDLMAPLLHEFTYQAMSHDLLPIKSPGDDRDAGNDGERVTYRMEVTNDKQVTEEKDVEILEKDPVWVDTRHTHMTDTIDKIMKEFKKFTDANPDLAGKDASLSDIKDMLAGLPQYQESKKLYNLHLTMAQDAMKLFSQHKLADLASVEQTLATGTDESLRKPKNILDEIVRLLDDPAILPIDRMRLIAIYVMYRDGVIEEDIKRLLWHASLEQSRGSLDLETILNLEFLGARPTRQLKDQRQPIPPVFPANTKNAAVSEEYALSRYETAVKHMLEGVCGGTLDTSIFPYTRPPRDPAEEAALNVQSSLRTGAPRWASANRRQAENRQRIFVFMAGGATYSEARACYEVSAKNNRDVFLITSHMVTPRKFINDLRLLKAPRRNLNLLCDKPPPRPPAHLFEKPAPPKPQPPPPQQQQIRPGGPQPPIKGMQAMTLNSGGPSSSSSLARPSVDERPSSRGSDKDKKKDKEKKKRNLFKLGK